MKKNNRHNQAKDLKRQKKKAQRKKEREQKRKHLIAAIPDWFVNFERPKIPTWAYDSWGQLTEKDLSIITDKVNSDLQLLQLGSWDKCPYNNLLFAMKQFFAFCKNFDNSTQNELLATMGTAAIHAVLNLAEQERDGAKRRDDIFNAAFAPLDHAMQTYFAMMHESYRSEHEAARRMALKMNLTEALKKVAVGGIALMIPDQVEKIREHCGKQGVAYIGGQCRVGRLSLVNDSPCWIENEQKAKLSIASPALAFFVETKPSQAA